MQKAKLCSGAVVVLIAAMATSVAAQAPRLEVSGGYQASYDGSIEQPFPAGWNVDVAANLNDAFAIVGEFGGAYRSDTDLDIDLDVYTFGGGARWSHRRMSRVVPFAQVVLGVARLGSSASIVGREIGASQTRLMLQPGGGVNILIRERWGLVGQADYRRIFLDNDQDGESGINEFRIFAGVRFGF